MRKKSYLSFKDLRAFYDKKTDTIRLTSGDPDLAAQGWSLTLNRETPAEQILREELTEAGIITARTAATEASGPTRVTPQDEIQQYIKLLVRDAVKENSTLTFELNSEELKVSSLGSNSGASKIVSSAPREMGVKIIQRLKWLGGVSPSSRVPSDSKFELPYGMHDQTALVRLATVSSINGENAYLRAIGLESPEVTERIAELNEADLDLSAEPLEISYQGGPYLGYTTGKMRQPVFFSPHDAIERNDPPATLITGSPGSGKSVATLSIVYQMLLRGVRTVYIDPHGEASALFRMPNVKDKVAIKVRDLPEGALNPFTLSEDVIERQDIALAVLTQLLGGQAEIHPQDRIVLATAVVEVSQEADPSLDKVVERLGDTKSGSLAAELKLIRRLPFASLLFGQASWSLPQPANLLTVLSTLGLTLPAKSTPVAAYSNPERLGVAVMQSLLRVAEVLTRTADRSERKSIVIEEAWLMTLTGWGNSMIEQIARIGRNLNIALLLVEAEDSSMLSNAVSTRMVFREVTPTQISTALAQLELDDNSFNRARLRNLVTGEGFFRQGSHLPATVKIEVEKELQDAITSSSEPAEAAPLLERTWGGRVTYYRNGTEAWAALQEAAQLLTARQQLTEEEGAPTYRGLLTGKEALEAKLTFKLSTPFLLTRALREEGVALERAEVIAVLDRLRKSGSQYDIFISEG